MYILCELNLFNFLNNFPLLSPLLIYLFNQLSLNHHFLVNLILNLTFNESLPFLSLF